MAFSTGSDSGGPMADINVTPLVDVMLVLLIIFIITAPLMSHKIQIELPQANLVLEEDDRKPPAVQPITISVKEDGSVYWNDELVTNEMLESRLSIAAQQQPQPKLNLRGDRTTRMSIIKEVTSTAQKQGMLDVGYIATKEVGQ